MKSKLLFGVCLIINLYGYAQNVNIPDVNFKSLLVANSNINTNGDGEIQVTEATSYTGTISVASQNIQDLTGIEAFTEIVALQAFFNPISSIDISQNTKLTQLLIEQTNISGELDLSMLTQLTDFKGHTTNLTAVNMANGNNVNMTRFQVQGTLVTCVQIDPSFTPNNDWMIPTGSSYSESCPEFTCIVDIPDPIFKSFLLGSANVNTNGNNEIECSEASSFTGQLFLTVLNIQDLTGIEAFTSLTSLNCSETGLSSIDVSANISLTYLNISNTDIAAIDLSTNSVLDEFIAVNTSLTSIDVSANTVLTRILVGVNAQLNELNVANGNNMATGDSDFFASDCPNLTCITVDDVAYSNANWTNIDSQTGFSTNCNSACVVNIPDANFKTALLNDTSINTNGNAEIECSEASAYTGAINVQGEGIIDTTGIEAFTAITELRCSNNQLTSLDVSQNTALTLLECALNQITSLDLSQNIALTRLDCSLNQLISLNIANGNNTNISNANFITQNNQNLTCVQVDDVAYSNTNWTNIDAQTGFSTDCSSNTDTTPPVAVCQDITIQLDANGNVSILADDINNGSTDDVALGGISVTPSIFDCDDLGANTVTFTAIDTSGNTDTCTATVTVVDTINPTIVPVADITENVDTGMCSAMVSFPVIIVNDNCSSTSFTTDAPAGQIFPVGTTVVTVTGMDDSGNIATDSFNVTVVDNEAPVLDCVVLETIEVNEGETFTLPDYVSDGDTNATDNCSVTITQDPAAGTELGADTYQLTFTATDASGNIDTCTQNLIIEEVLSVQDVSLENTISIYPNPATDVIQIASEIALTNVEVYNINGQLVLTSNLSEEIDISKLSSGVYFVTLYSETSFITKKLIKK